MRHAVILAGGSGQRFWPVSREDRPKQFLPLAGETSLLRATFERIVPVIPAERIWVVTLQRHASRVRRELPELNPRRVLGEPRARNTGPALYLASLAIGNADPDASMMVVPADAWVPRVTPYRRAMRSALRLAEKDPRLILVGVRPTRVETGYGYIEPGQQLNGGPAKTVKRFVEKPSPARAKKFVSGRRHLWNCGIFAWRAEVFNHAVEEHLPRLMRAFRPLRTGRRSAGEVKKAYDRAPSISVDHGILERAGNIAVVPADFPWDDLGSWRALERLGKGGFRRGRVEALDSPGLIAWAESGTVAVIGLSDVVVVHTSDATLVMAKDRAQDVRTIVDALKKKTKRANARGGLSKP